MKNFQRPKIIDIFYNNKTPKSDFDLPLVKFIGKYKNSSTLFSKYGISNDFITESVEYHFVKNKKSLYLRNLDGIQPAKKSSYKEIYKQQSFDLYRQIQKRYANGSNYLKDFFRGSVQGVSAVKMWNLSIVTALFFGMFLMTFIYRYLGQGAEAVSKQVLAQNNTSQSQFSKKSNQGMVLGESMERFRGGRSGKENTKIVDNYKKQNETAEQRRTEKNLQKMLKGYPIEKMIPYIAKQNKTVAAFLVGIARKESNWGRRVPVYKGQDCFNYWGFRAKRKKMGSGGHTCFNSPKDAVDTVARRINYLVTKEKINNPRKMVVIWKCGYDCSWDSPKAVNKWVSDVNIYFKEFQRLNRL